MLSKNRLKTVLCYYHKTGEFYYNATNERADPDHLRIDGERHSARRLAWLYMTGTWPHHPVYVINGKAHDLRWANLTRTQSEAVRGICNVKQVSKNNASGVTGVSFQKRDKLWVATIMIDGKRKYLGSFADKGVAIAARLDAETKLKEAAMFM